MPPHIAAGLPGDGAAGSPHDQQMFDRRATRRRLIRDLLHLHQPAAPGEAVGCHQQRRLAILHPRRHRLRPKARENRCVGRAELGAGQRDDGDLGEHGEKDCHSVSPTHPQSPEDGRGTADLGIQLPVGEGPLRAVFAFPSDCQVSGARAGAVLVDAVVHQIQTTADKPLRPLDPFAQVQHPRVRGSPLDPHLLERRLPEPLHLADRAVVERGIVRDPMPLHEAKQPAPLHIVRRGMPELRYVGQWGHRLAAAAPCTTNGGGSAGCGPAARSHGHTSR